MRKQENILEDLWVSSTSEILDRATASMVNCDETLESISVLSSPKTPCDFDYVPILKSALIDRPLDDVSHNMQSTEGYNFGEAAQHSPRSSKRQRTDMDITPLTTILETKEPIKIDLFQDLLSKLHLDQGPCPPEVLIQELARMHADFKRLVLHVPDLRKVRTDVELRAWLAQEETRSRAWLREASVAGVERITKGEWSLETRLEVAAGSASGRAKGFVKLRVLSRGGEPFLVLVDWLYRAAWAGPGAVGAALLRRALGGWPGCRVALCTVRPRRPAPHAQQHADHARVTARYEEAGFERLVPGDEMLAWLRRARGGEEEHGGPVWRDLTALVAEHLSDSLPVLECDMKDGARPITWWEHRADGPEADSRRERWARATVGTERDASERDAWLVVGADVEVLWGEDWWEARVRKVKAPGAQTRGGVRVVVHYVGDDESKVGGTGWVVWHPSLPAPAHTPLHGFGTSRPFVRPSVGHSPPSLASPPPSSSRTHTSPACCILAIVGGPLHLLCERPHPHTASSAGAHGAAAQVELILERRRLRPPQPPAGPTPQRDSSDGGA